MRKTGTITTKERNAVMLLCQNKKHVAAAMMVIDRVEPTKAKVRFVRFIEAPNTKTRVNRTNKP
jgi:hypothetical protein